MQDTQNSFEAKLNGVHTDLWFIEVTAFGRWGIYFIEVPPHVLFSMWPLLILPQKMNPKSQKWYFCVWVHV